jgi:hypothetical protein
MMWGKTKKEFEALKNEVKQLRELIERTIARDDKQIEIMNKIIIKDGIKEAIQETTGLEGLIQIELQ